MTVTESKSCRTYSKIFLPSNFQLKSKELDENKKEILSFIDFPKIEEKSNFKSKMKIVLKDYVNDILKKNNEIFFFESLEDLLNELKS